MTNSTYDLTISLLFKSVKDIEHISSIMEVQPTSYINKEHSKYRFIECDTNVWVYAKKYQDHDGSIAVHIGDFFSYIPDYLSKIASARKHADCTLRISIVTDWAQSGFSLGTNELEIIRSLDIPLEVSIFSWGNCMDE